MAELSSESKQATLRGKVTLVSASKKKSHISTGGSLHPPRPALTHTLILAHKQNSSKDTACQTLWDYQPDFFSYELCDNRSGFFMQALFLKPNYVRVRYLTELRNSKFLEAKHMKSHVWTPGFLWCCLLSVWEGKVFLYTYSNIYLHMRQLVIVQEEEKNWYML